MASKTEKKEIMPCVLVFVILSVSATVITFVTYKAAHQLAAKAASMAKSAGSTPNVTKVATAAIEERVWAEIEQDIRDGKVLEIDKDSYIINENGPDEREPKVMSKDELIKLRSSNEFNLAQLIDLDNLQEKFETLKRDIAAQIKQLSNYLTARGGVTTDDNGYHAQSVVFASGDRPGGEKPKAKRHASGIN